MVDLTKPFADLLTAMGLELYDLDYTGSQLNVTVSKPGGIDVDTLAAANSALSAWLDEHDPIAGRYTLDVSSPGLERKLRTPAHFASAVGSVVTLRERRAGEPTRRLEGELLRVQGNVVTLKDKDLGELDVDVDQVERARTVFVWGAQPKPSPSKGAPKNAAKTTAKKTTAKKTTAKGSK